MLILAAVGPDSDSDEEEVEEEDREVQQAADAMMTAELPPPCLDVTIALRFMVDKDNSSITFHQVRLTLLWRILPTFLRRSCNSTFSFSACVLPSLGV